MAVRRRGPRLALGAAVLVGLVGVVVWAWRGGDRLLAGVGAVALTAAASATWLTSNLPLDERRLETLDMYRVHWWPVGLVLTLATLWSAVAVARRSPTGRALAAALVDRRRLVPAAAAVLAVVVVMFAPVRFTPATAGFGDPRDAITAHATAIAGLDADPVLLTLDPPAGGGADPLEVLAVAYAQTLIGQLRLRGITVHVDPDGAGTDAALAPYREAYPATGDEPVVVRLRITPDALTGAPPTGYEVLSAHDPADDGDDAPPGTFALPSVVYVDQG